MNGGSRSLAAAPWRKRLPIKPNNMPGRTWALKKHKVLYDDEVWLREAIEIRVIVENRRRPDGAANRPIMRRELKYRESSLLRSLARTDGLRPALLMAIERFSARGADD